MKINNIGIFLAMELIIGVLIIIKSTLLVGLMFVIYVLCDFLVDYTIEDKGYANRRKPTLFKREYEQ